MPIGPFILRRLGSGLLSVLGVSVLVFFFLHLTPGDPVDHLTGGEATESQVEAMRDCLYLDRSLPEQFGIFLGHVADGSLGRQCPNPEGKPTVMARIVEVFPATFELALASMVVAFLLGLPLGIAAALRRGSWVDAGAAAFSVFGYSVPIPLLGPLMIFVFYIYLGWLPGPAEPDAALALLMPSICLGTALMAMLSRMTRSSLGEVLREDYMTTARAKGLPESAVILKHGLRNALLPVITVAGLQFGALLSGAIVVEKIFARPGLGTLLLEGIQERNYPLVQGSVLVIAACYVAVNMLVDLTYGLVDPRIRHA